MSDLLVKCQADLRIYLTLRPVVVPQERWGEWLYLGASGAGRHRTLFSSQPHTARWTPGHPTIQHLYYYRCSFIKACTSELTDRAWDPGLRWASLAEISNVALSISYIYFVVTGSSPTQLGFIRGRQRFRVRSSRCSLPPPNAFRIQLEEGPEAEGAEGG